MEGAGTQLDLCLTHIYMVASLIFSFSKHSFLLSLISHGIILSAFFSLLLHKYLVGKKERKKLTCEQFKLDSTTGRSDFSLQEN